MTPMFIVQLLFPIALLIVQTYIILFGVLYVMRKMSIITTAMADMEISHTVVAAAFLFGSFFISTADYSALLQTFKLHSTRGDALYSLTFYRFGQYFLDVIAAEIIFILLTWANVKIFLGGKDTHAEIKQGNIPLSIFVAVVTICFAIMTRYLTAEVIEYLTPKVIIFN